MPVHGSREDNIWNRGHGSRLSGTAAGPRRIAWCARNHPGFRAIVKLQRGEPATLNRIEARIADWSGTTNTTGRSDHVGNGGVHLRAVARHAPLHAAVGTASADAGLPDDAPLLIRI